MLFNFLNMYIVITIEGFLEVAVESCCEWGLNPQPLNFVKMLKSTDVPGHKFYIYT